jgi:hypothetical protein
MSLLSTLETCPIRFSASIYIANVPCRASRMQIDKAGMTHTHPPEHGTVTDEQTYLGASPRAPGAGISVCPSARAETAAIAPAVACGRPGPPGSGVMGSSQQYIFREAESDVYCMFLTEISCRFARQTTSTESCKYGAYCDLYCVFHTHEFLGVRSPLGEEV